MDGRGWGWVQTCNEVGLLECLRFIFLRIIFIFSRGVCLFLQVIALHARSLSYGDILGQQNDRRGARAGN
jgi:hypothetical protein